MLSYAYLDITANRKKSYWRRIKRKIKLLFMRKKKKIIERIRKEFENERD